MDAQTLNRMLDRRVRDLASRAPEGSPEERRRALAKALGLEPAPPRTEANARMTGSVDREGYRIEKIRYESRPGVFVAAHLYLPLGEGKWPLVLRPHGGWPGKKAEPLVQAGAIGLALSGFAVLVVEAPGRTIGDDSAHAANERAGMGAQEDFALSMGVPAAGVYVWDVLRAIDVAEAHLSVDATRVGITGEGAGGLVAICAFAIDRRIRAVVPVGCGASYEDAPQSLGLPGGLVAGDVSDVLALRADDGAVLMLGAEEDSAAPIAGLRRTEKKLKRSLRNAYLEVFLGGHDYNRRMRETALAFFRHHLRGDPARAYASEPLPLTDGRQNPAPANTVPSDDPSLRVFGVDEPPSRTFRDLLTQALAEPYPEVFDPSIRLVPWGKYGRLDELRLGSTLALHDPGYAQSEPGSVEIPHAGVDLGLCHLLGLSVAETIAQVLHLSVPGGPSGWEERGVAVGDALTSLVASMKTLVSGPGSAPAVQRVVAQGPVASLVAHHFAGLRPEVQVHASHPAAGWGDAFAYGVPAMIQPQARYLGFTTRQPVTSDAPPST